MRGTSWRGLAEEKPEAYKDIDVVAEISDAAGLARRVARLVPLGVVKGTKHPSEARALYRWLQGEEARSVFEKYGFKGVAAPPSK